jgi:hypothetical protein
MSFPQSAFLGRGKLTFLLTSFFAADVFLTTHIVSKFHRLFDDSIPGRKLPSLTVFFLNYRAVNVALAFIWLIAALYVLTHHHRGWLGLFFLLVALHVTLLVIALLMPFVGGLTGMSGTN